MSVVDAQEEFNAEVAEAFEEAGLMEPTPKSKEFEAAFDPAPDDDGDDDDFRARIWNAEQDCRRRELRVEICKDDLKSAKTEYDAAVERLRKIANEGSQPSRSVEDVLLAVLASHHIFNASRTITGKEARSLKTTHEAITTKQRFRIIERAGGKCETCGSRSLLTVGHVVSVADGHKAGLSGQIINSDENLICQCAECNSGTGEGTIPLRMYMLILNTRDLVRKSPTRSLKRS